jgi:hypothetical protein
VLAAELTFVQIFTIAAAIGAAGVIAVAIAGIAFRRMTFPVAVVGFATSTAAVFLRMKQIAEQAIIFTAGILATHLISMMSAASSNEHQPNGNKKTSPFSVKHRSPPQDNRTVFHWISARPNRSVESTMRWKAFANE